MPSVVRLARYVRVPYRREVPLTRRAVLDRDGHARRTAACGPTRSITCGRARAAGCTSGRTWSPRAPDATIARATGCSQSSAGACATPAQPPATVAVVMGWTRREPSWQHYLDPAWTSMDVAPAV